MLLLTLIKFKSDLKTVGGGNFKGLLLHACSNMALIFSNSSPRRPPKQVFGVLDSRPTLFGMSKFAGSKKHIS